MSAEAPFLGIPSGLDIAHYFWEETDHRNPGCDGIDLWRDGSDYCYLWVEAMVDHDMWESYLLDVRTKTGENESRDYLFLHVGASNTFEVTWQNKPVDFGDAGLDRLIKGLDWFTGHIEDALDTLTAERKPEPKREVHDPAEVIAKHVEPEENA